MPNYSNYSERGLKFLQCPLAETPCGYSQWHSIDPSSDPWLLQCLLAGAQSPSDHSRPTCPKATAPSCSHRAPEPLWRCWCSHQGTAPAAFQHRASSSFPSRSEPFLVWRMWPSLPSGAFPSRLQELQFLALF